MNIILGLILTWGGAYIMQQALYIYSGGDINSINYIIIGIVFTIVGLILLYKDYKNE